MRRALALWKDTEPVRLYLYTVLVPLVALLVMRGALEADESLLLLGIGAAALGVPGVEAARSRVTSPATLRAALGDRFRDR